MKTCVLILVFCVCYALSWQMFATKKAGRPGDCFDESYGIGAMKAGDMIKPRNRCVRAMCSSNGDIVYVGCGATVVRPECRLEPANDSLPYPQCCERAMICDEKKPVTAKPVTTKLLNLI